MKSLIMFAAPKCNKVRFVVFSLVILLVSGCVTSNTISEYEKLISPVPYSEVAKLSNDSSRIGEFTKIKYGSFDDQYFLFWPAYLNPSRASDIDKTLVFIHGGCWLAQFDITHSNPLASALAEQGYNVYSIEYRRAGNGGEWPVALNDVMSALARVASQIREAPSPSTITMIGHSAGGHLASLAAYASTQRGEELGYPLFDNVHLVGLAPIIDIKSYAKGDNSCQTATPLFMNGSETQQNKAYNDADPLRLDLTNLASATMFIGGQDNVVPQDIAHHPNAQTIQLDAAGHFDWIHPDSSGFELLVTHLNKTSTLRVEETKNKSAYIKK